MSIKRNKLPTVHIRVLLFIWVNRCLTRKYIKLLLGSILCFKVVWHSVVKIRNILYILLIINIQQNVYTNTPKCDISTIKISGQFNMEKSIIFVHTGWDKNIKKYKPSLETSIFNLKHLTLSYLKGCQPHTVYKQKYGANKHIEVGLYTCQSWTVKYFKDSWQKPLAFSNGIGLISSNIPSTLIIESLFLDNSQKLKAESLQMFFLFIVTSWSFSPANHNLHCH